MAGKKKGGASARGRRLAGEPVFASMLSPPEERLLTEVFSHFRGYTMPLDAPPAITATASMMRSRENAARLSLSFFCRHCEGMYSRKDVVEGLATAAALPVRLEELFADERSVALGAAFWLLDYFELNELDDKYLPLLPEEADDETDYTLPEAVDLSHPRALAVRMAEVLLKRKSSYRKQFRRLMGLIRRDDAAELRAVFRDCLLDYFDRYMEIRTRVRPAEEAPPDVPFSMAPMPAAGDLFETGPDRPAPPSAPSMEMAARTAPDILFLLRTPFLIGETDKKLLEDLHFRRMADLIADFTVRDPYELCAAYLLLQQEEDLLCDLNTLTAAALICAEHHLPWSYESSDGETLLYEYGVPSIYSMRYPFDVPNGDGREPGSEIEDDMLLSEAQLFYLISGCVPPRDRKPSPALANWFMKQGVPRPRARELSYAALMASAAADARSRAEFMAQRRAEPEEEAARESAPTEPSAQPTQPAAVQDNPEERIAELTRQLKASRTALHDAEQNAKTLQARLQEAERNAVRDRMELSNLRDALFRIKAGEEPEDAPEEDAGIRFPWQVKRRLLVFGGHDTWSKAIRPLLPGVRFFDRESLPDLNAVKAADAVWIQPNALSHKFYYRIIDTARKEDIPVHYFGYASARKCAEQLAAVELEEG